LLLLCCTAPSLNRRALAWLFFRTKRLTGRLPRWLRCPLMPPLRWLSGELKLGWQRCSPYCLDLLPRQWPYG
jgi:hypothetical protein